MPLSTRKGNKAIITPLEDDPTEEEALRQLSTEDQSNIGKELDKGEAKALLNRFTTKIKEVIKKKRLN